MCLKTLTTYSAQLHFVSSMPQWTIKKIKFELCKPTLTNSTKLYCTVHDLVVNKVRTASTACIVPSFPADLPYYAIICSFYTKKLQITGFTQNRFTLADILLIWPKTTTGFIISNEVLLYNTLVCWKYCYLLDFQQC